VRRGPSQLFGLAALIGLLFASPPDELFRAQARRTTAIRSWRAARNDVSTELHLEPSVAVQRASDDVRPERPAAIVDQPTADSLCLAPFDPPRSPVASPFLPARRRAEARAPPAPV
jgi:hypothetical protein